MKPRTIYRKTLGFVFLKLAAQLLCAFISLGLLAVAYMIATKTTNAIAAVAAFGLWTLVTFSLAPILNRFGGYLIKAGHVAAVTEAVRKKECPKNPVGYGMQKVKERFPVAATYFFVDKLVDGAVKQLQRLLQKTVGELSYLAGFGILNFAISGYMRIAVGSIDDCCLGYTFDHPKQGAVHSACDAVVIYVKNWKPIMKQAVKTLGWATLVTCVFVAVPVIALLIGYLVRETLTWRYLPILLLAVYVGTGVKTAVVDSYVMVRMVASFHEEAEDTELDKEYFDTLSKMSGKFKRLFKASKKEDRERKEKREKKKAETAAPDPKDILEVGGDIVWRKET